MTTHHITHRVGSQESDAILTDKKKAKMEKQHLDDHPSFVHTFLDTGLSLRVCIEYDNTMGQYGVSEPM